MNYDVGRREAVARAEPERGGGGAPGEAQADEDDRRSIQARWRRFDQRHTLMPLLVRRHRIAPPSLAMHGRQLLGSDTGTHAMEVERR